MAKKFITRREFVRYLILPFLLIINSCKDISKKSNVVLQKSFYSNYFISILPKNWKKQNINYANIALNQNKIKLNNSDFTIINDGWIGSLNFDNYANVNLTSLKDSLDIRAINYLNLFDQYKRNKIFPIGVIPYAVIIKNNNNLIDLAKKSWDFLLSDQIKGKLILPQSPRVIISISKKINFNNSLEELRNQAKVFDDKNALNWLLNSDACVAIMPYHLCYKFLKLDSRLSIVFPNQGVPLMWNFILMNSKKQIKILSEWIEKLNNKFIIDKLSNEGWYFPFKNEYSQSKYYQNEKFDSLLKPSKDCWDNSWSLNPINNNQKLELEKLWYKSLFP